MASIEPIAEDTTLRLDSGTTLGTPVVPPVGSSATMRLGSAVSLSFGTASGVSSSPSKAPLPPAGKGTMRLRLGANFCKPSTCSYSPPAVPGGGTRSILALTALTCAAIASLVNRRFSGCAVAALIDAQYAIEVAVQLGANRETISP